MQKPRENFRLARLEHLSTKLWPHVNAEKNETLPVPGAEEMGQGEGIQSQSCGLMAAALDLHLTLAKLLILMTLGRCLHLYNRDKKSLSWPG